MTALLRTLPLLAAFLLATVAAPGLALAQDWRQPPAFGEVSLSAGFTPDPHRVAIVAGGSLDAASAIGGDCAGHIADAPDFRLQYSAGSYALTIFATSTADTTLVINAPDGQWYCDDDRGTDWNPMDPGITFPSPQSGQYDIWLGSYAAGENPQAEIFISELH